VSNKYPKQIGNCPYCLTIILDSEKHLICPGCEVPHHKECWQQNDGCTTFACEGKALVNRNMADKDYDFEDLVEEYSLNKIVINMEDLFDDINSSAKKDVNQDRRLPANNRRSSSRSGWLSTLFWILFICGLLIWLYYANL
jgi:hypothetical protein